MSEIGVTVRVDKDHASKFASIVLELERVGLNGIQRQDRFLMVQGYVRPDRLVELRRMEGVASVREEQSYSAL